MSGWLLAFTALAVSMACLASVVGPSVKALRVAGFVWPIVALIWCFTAYAYSRGIR